MRKLSLTMLALFVSFNANAASKPLTLQDLSTAISKNIGKPAATHPHATAIVYGGKDIASSILAIAHESTWMKQQVFVG